MNISERRTKIVCTLGPSSNTKEVIEKLARNGMNVARLNFSHGSHKDHKKVIDHIRTIGDRYGISLSILIDLQGPKIRVGKMKNGSQVIERGDYVTITSEQVEGTSDQIPVDYPELAQDAVEGNLILIDDGLLELKVVKKNSNSLIAQVMTGGELKSRKGVNLPDVKLSMSSLTEKDVEDLNFAVEMEADYVAMSFVRTANDIQDVISRIRANGGQAGIIAKIEKP